MRQQYHVDVWSSLLILFCIVASFTCLPPSTSACTIFSIVGDDVVLMGNNEDFNKRGAVWFVPGKDGRFGRVNFGFHGMFGRRENFAQGSMNEKGLAFDAAVAAKVPWNEDPEKETPDNLLEKIMDECSTVAEAVEYFRKYNCRHLAESQFLLADASGASCVVTWLADNRLSVVYRDTPTLVATNTRLEPSGYRCQRWTRATRELSARGLAPFERARRALQAVHQHGPGGFTSYSCIYDLKRQRVFLYNLTNFEEVLELDLHAEISKGPTSHLLKDLFERSPSLKEVKSKPQRVTYSTRIRLSAQELKQFEGIYSPTVAPHVRVRIEATDDGLRVHNPGQPAAELFPEAPTVFRLAPDRGQVSFQRASDGTVTSLTLHKGQDVVAQRL